MAYLGANRVAEHHQLHRGNRDEHHERQRVATHVNEFLLEHRPYVMHPEADGLPHDRMACSRSSFSWSATKTSSMVFCANSGGISSGAPVAMRCPRDRKASRVHCDASSM